MGVLDGVRFLSSCWVIVFHRFFILMFGSNINTIDVQHWIRQVHSMIIQGGTVSVDTFFTISGMLVLTSFFKSMERENNINLLRFYLHRYLRVTPSLALIALINATILKYAGSGIFWLGGLNGLQLPCRDHWWGALLYIQNYLKVDALCVVQTWYLCCDMQLFWISPLILYPLYKKPTIGIILLIVMVCLPMVVSFYLAWIYQYNGGLLFQKDLLPSHYFTRHYTQTHVRASPWFLGLGLGYAVQKTRNKKVVINSGLVGLLWLATFLLLIVVVFGIYPFQQFEQPLMHLRASAYLAFTRTAWSMAIAWIIFACIHGYGGIINTILSWPVFSVLNKLSYGMFLIHLMIQFLMTAAMKTPNYYTLFSEVHTAFADVLVSIFMAYVLTVCFEMPIHTIEDYFWKKSKNQVNKNKIETPQ